MGKNKKLSILLVTYNHEHHIREAVRSIIQQKKPESISKIEVIVCDDNSTDRTLEYIREFEGQSDFLSFRILPPQPNLGITRNYQRGFAACDGEYVAILEGDDHWFDSEKLIEQVAVLDSEANCILCSTNYVISDEKSGSRSNRVSSVRGWRAISVPELIEDNIIGNFSTCMYRREGLTQLPERLFELKSYDWIVNICAGMRGDIIFLHKPMSVYRLHSQGVWSSMDTVGKMKAQLDALAGYDELTEHQFRNEFLRLEKHLSDQISESLISPKKKGPLSRTWRKIKNQLRGTRQ